MGGFTLYCEYSLILKIPPDCLVVNLQNWWHIHTKSIVGCEGHSRLVKSGVAFGFSPSGPVTINYTYDPVGNRTSKQTTVQYDALCSATHPDTERRKFLQSCYH